MNPKTIVGKFGVLAMLLGTAGAFAQGSRQQNHDLDLIRIQGCPTTAGINPECGLIVAGYDIGKAPAQIDPRHPGERPTGPRLNYYRVLLVGNVGETNQCRHPVLWNITWKYSDDDDEKCPGFLDP